LQDAQFLLIVKCVPSYLTNMSEITLGRSWITHVAYFEEHGRPVGHTADIISVYISSYRLGEEDTGE